MNSLPHRHPSSMRAVEFVLDYTPHALASVLAKAQHTQVITACSYQDEVPHWLRAQKQRGWISAEYNLLPSSTHERQRRERHHPSGRTFEIQRLISRSLRAAVNLKAIPQHTLLFDCDVISADGGTRTTSLNGCMAALIVANHRLVSQGKIPKNSLITKTIAAVSVAIHKGELIVDPNYQIDSVADTDMTIIMDSTGELVEIQGCAEHNTFSPSTVVDVLELAFQATKTLFHQFEQLTHSLES